MQDILSSNTDCRVLDLSRKGLTGTIPWDVLTGMIRKRGLKELRLSHNKFDARELPDDLDFDGLEILHLNGIESLRGPIPERACSRWHSLKEFEVDGTLLSGKQ